MSKLHSYFTGTVAALILYPVSIAWANESSLIRNVLLPQNSTTWSNKDGSSWLMRSNWSNGVPDDDGNTDVVIWVDGETRIDIPEDGVTVNELTVAGSGVLTIAGGKISSSYINIGTDVVASQSTLALSQMQILPGVTISYSTTTSFESLPVVDEDHPLAIKGLTGGGTFKKTGSGVLALFNTDVEASIVVAEGMLMVCDESDSAPIDITVENGAVVNLSAAYISFLNSDNSIVLKGGSQLWLSNGADLSGTITIEDAYELSAKICGSSLAPATISADITGEGNVEFADGGEFGSNIFKCEYPTTYSGSISGDLTVIVSDKEEITFTSGNDYMGGTIILADSILCITDPSSLSTGNITGSGLLICDGCVSDNTNGLIDDTWNGCVKLKGNIQLENSDMSLEAFGNLNSKLQIEGDVKGYFAFVDDTTICDVPIELNGSLILRSGYNNKVYTIQKLTGSGTFTHSANLNYTINIVDASQFSGNLVITQPKAKIYIGTLDLTKTEAGGIVVTSKATVSSNSQWLPISSVVVTEGGELGGLGTIIGGLKFNDKSVLDVSLGGLTVEGDVTLPSSGGVTVAFNTQPVGGGTVIRCNNAQMLDLTKFSPAPDGFIYRVTGESVVLAPTKMSVACGETITVDSQEYAEMIVLNVVAPDDVEDPEFQSYYKKVVTEKPGDGGSVWELSAELDSEKVAPIIDSISFDDDGTVHITISNIKPSLYYGFRAYATLNGPVEIEAYYPLRGVQPPAVLSELLALKNIKNKAFFKAIVTDKLD